MIIKQLSVFVENKKGRMAEITNVLAKNNIDIRAISIADTTDYGILRLIVNNPQKAQDVLKSASMTVTLTGVIAIAIPDKPGGLSLAIQLLSDRDVQIEYMYAFLNPTDATAFVIMRVDNEENAIDALSKGGIRLMKEEEIYTI